MNKIKTKINEEQKLFNDYIPAKINKKPSALIQPCKQERKRTFERVALNKVEDILRTLIWTSRFSHEVIEFVTKVMKKHSKHFPEPHLFWKKVSDSLMNAKDYARKVNNLDLLELKELTAWTKNMASSAKKHYNNSTVSLGKSKSLSQIFHVFIDGEAGYLGKTLRCSKLSKRHQHLFSKEIYLLLEEEIVVYRIFTQIDPILYSYVSIVLKNDSIDIICTSPELNTKSHIKNVSRLINNNLEISYAKPTAEILDLILEFDNLILEGMIDHLIQLKNKIPILIYLFNDSGKINAFKFPDQYITEIYSSISKLSSFNGKSIQKWFLDLFALERTFSFTERLGASWVKQVRKGKELLDLFSEIEEVFIRYRAIKHAQSENIISDVKNTINKAFSCWITLKRHSSNPEYIGNLHIKEWINCLDFVNEDRLGYLLHFNFDEIKVKVQKAKLRKYKETFIERFTILRHGTNMADRWDGIIYDNIGKFERVHSDKSNKYVFRVRNNAKIWKSNFERSLIKDLERIALTDIRMLKKYFQNDSLQFLKLLWINAGYETPEDFLKSFSNQTNNPLNILKGTSVKIKVINGTDILNKEIVMKNLKFYFKLFKENYINSKLIDNACRAKIITETNINKNKVLKYLSKRTKNEIPIPRYSKRRGLVFASITNEIENAAAVRVFLDILTNSNEGRWILLNIGLLSQKNFDALMSKKANYIINWKKGISTRNVENQIAGLPDGLVTIKQGNNYSDEFFVEMVGWNKSVITTGGFLLSSPYSTLIADLLRIACNGAAGKPGIVVFGRFDKNGELIYTIIRFDSEVISRVKNAGAQFAIELNRPKVRMLLKRGNNNIQRLIKKAYYDSSSLELTTDLNKYLLDSPTNLELYKLFYTIIKIVLGVKENKQ